MSLDATPEPPKTLSVPRAGKQYFALSRGASYAAAARGELPTIRIGRKIRVPIIALERMLEQAGNTAAIKRPDPISNAAPTRNTRSTRGTR